MNSETINNDKEKNETKEENSEKLYDDEENDSNFLLLNKSSKGRDNKDYSMEIKELNIIQKLYIKAGFFFQNTLLFILSNKINISPNHKKYLIFYYVGLILTIFALFYFPNLLLNTRMSLLFFSLGNLLLIISFCYYYGSKAFFEILADRKNTVIVFSHLIGIFFGFIFLITFYLIQLLLIGLMFYTTPRFFILLLPTKEEYNKKFDKISKCIKKIKNKIFKKNKDANADIDTYNDVNRNGEDST